MNIIEQLEQEEMARLGKTIPDFSPGDTAVLADPASRTADLGGKTGTQKFGALVAEAIRAA